MRNYSIKACVIIASSAILLVTVLIGCSATNRVPDWMNFSLANKPMAVPILWETSVDNAIADSDSSGRTIMLWFTGSDWCKYCTKLENEVFHTAEFNTWSSQNIVPVMLDFPKQKSLSPELELQNSEVMEQYGQYVSSYPTALFINQAGEVIGKLSYARGGPEPWIEKADAILARQPAAHTVSTSASPAQTGGDTVTR